MSGGVGSALNGTALDRALAAINAANSSIVRIEELVAEAGSKAAAGAVGGISQLADELRESVDGLGAALRAAEADLDAIRAQIDSRAPRDVLTSGTFRPAPGDEPTTVAEALAGVLSAANAGIERLSLRLNELSTNLNGRLRVDSTQSLSSAQLSQALANLGVTPYIKTLLDDATAATARVTLELGSAATRSAESFAAAAHGHAIPAIDGLQSALDGKQAVSTKLAALAALSLVADRLPYATGGDSFAATVLTVFARTLLDDPDAAAVRATLGLGSAALLAAGTGAGMVPVLDANGKLLSSLLSSLAITDTFEVASQAEMLALATAQAGDARLPAERGDIAVRSDLNRTFILKAEPASTLANWIELKTPTDLVLSVAGLNGAITAAQLRAALALVVSDVSGLQSALDGKQPVDATLTALAAVATAADRIIYATGVDAFSTSVLTAFGRSVLAGADATAVRTLLGLGSAALSAAGAFQAALGFTPVQQGGGAGQSTSKVYVGFSGTDNALKCQVDVTDLGKIWTDFNAGRLLTTSGYHKFPSGFIVQWGAVTNTGSDYSVVFPIAFSGDCYGVFAQPIAAPASGEAFVVNISSFNLTGFACSCRAISSSGPASKPNLPIRYFAWGVL